MRKSLIIVLAAIAAAAFITSCGGNSTAPETAAAETSTETEIVKETEPVQQETAEEQFAGLANPMVGITDPAEFDKQLGIHIDMSWLPKDAKLFIIDKNLAHIAWTQKNVNNEDVEFVFRATKDPELGPTCHGIYGTLTDQYEMDIPGGKPGQKLTVSRCDKYEIYTWKNGDTFFSLTYDNNMSQMAVAEVLDSVMFASGTVIPAKTIYPIPENVDTANIADGIYRVNMAENGIREDNGKYFMTCDIYSMELFDAVDVNGMKPGDTIVIGGDRFVEVRTVDDRDGEIVINKGDNNGNEVILAADEGGTYIYRGDSDVASYRNHGNAELEIADDVVLTDTSDIENGCREVIVNGPKEVSEYLKSSPYANLAPHSGSVLIEKKKITEIKTWYTP